MYQVVEILFPCEALEASAVFAARRLCAPVAWPIRLDIKTPLCSTPSAQKHRTGRAEVFLLLAGNLQHPRIKLRHPCLAFVATMLAARRTQ